MTKEDDFIFCRKCGEKLAKEAKFCSACGNKVNILKDETLQQEIKEVHGTFNDVTKDNEIYEDMTKNNQTYDNFNSKTYDKNYKVNFEDDDRVKFVQNNVDYYITRFEKIQKTNNKITWNWASFFFSGYWCLYRKMYALGAGIIVGQLILDMILPSFIISLVVAVACGLYGNFAYMKFMEGKLETFSDMSQTARENELLRTGGVSVLIPIAAVVIVIIVLILL